MIIGMRRLGTCILTAQQLKQLPWKLLGAHTGSQNRNLVAYTHNLGAPGCWASCWAAALLVISYMSNLCEAIRPVSSATNLWLGGGVGVHLFRFTTSNNYTPHRLLRSSSLNLLSIPKTKTVTCGDRSFSVIAPKLWNDLPIIIKQCSTVDS